MLIREFAAIVITELEYLKMKYTPHLRLRYPVSNFDAGYYKLLDLATQNKDSTLEANSETLMPFINELRVNWENIKGKPTQYNMQPDTLTTQAYIIVARHLAQVLNSHLYDHLMPDANIPGKWQKWDRQHKPLDIGELHEYFMTDTGEVNEITDAPKYKI